MKFSVVYNGRQNTLKIISFLRLALKMNHYSFSQGLKTFDEYISGWVGIFIL